MLSNNFAVKSESFALLAAFKTECEAMGWPYVDFNPFTEANHIEYSRALFFSDPFPGYEHPGFSLSRIGSNYPNLFELPAQWNEAIDRAREQFQPEQLQLNDQVTATIVESNRKVVVKFGDSRYDVSFEVVKLIYDKLKATEGSSFDKSKLRSGMLVELRNESRGLVLLNTEDGSDVIAGPGVTDLTSDNYTYTWAPLETYHDDLTTRLADFDIVKVWSGNGPGNRGRAGFSVEQRDVLWTRFEDTLDLGLKWPVLFRKGRVHVGCQSIAHDAVEKLYHAIYKSK